MKDYGCNLRSLRKVLGGGRAVIDGRIESTVSDLDLMTLQRMLEVDIDCISDCLKCHTLITSLCTQQPGPTTRKYLDSDIVSRTLAGSVVYKALLRRHGAEFHRQIRFKPSLYGKVGGAASAGGGLWEMWCHQEIPKLRHLNLIRMVVKEGKLVRSDHTERISIGSLTHQIYTSQDSRKSTVDPMKYYVPYEDKDASFDAFCRSEGNGIGLQMTLATTHPVAPSGLGVLKKRLSANANTSDYYFVFVIPKGQEFDCEAPERKSAFTFCILELDDGKYSWSPLDL